MKFGGEDGNRLMTMGKWALTVRRQVNDGILCFQDRAFCTRFIHEGIERVKSVIVMRAGDTLGKTPLHKWEEDWFGGFLWLHEDYCISHDEARAFYFSEELMQFWSNVMNVANRGDSTVYGEEIVEKVQNLEKMMKSEDSMLELKRVMDHWARNTLERSPLFKNGDRNKKRAASTKGVHHLGHKLRKIPEEQDASIDEAVGETDKRSIPICRGNRKGNANAARKKKARKLIYEEKEEETGEGMGHVESDDQGAGNNSEVKDDTTVTRGFSIGADHGASSERRRVSTLPCELDRMFLCSSRPLNTPTKFTNIHMLGRCGVFNKRGVERRKRKIIRFRKPQFPDLAGLLIP